MTQGAAGEHSGAHPALRPRPPPLPWLAWVASPHHHAPSGREVDGALSRPSPRRNGAPNTCPDYCAFPGCSLSVREGSVRVVLSSIPRPPPPSPPLWLYSLTYHREAARRNQTRSRDPRLASMPLWTGWPATTTPGIATRRFPPAVILCELCVLICQQYTYSPQPSSRASAWSCLCVRRNWTPRWRNVCCLGTAPWCDRRRPPRARVGSHCSRGQSHQTRCLLRNRASMLSSPRRS